MFKLLSFVIGIIFFVSPVLAHQTSSEHLDTFSSEITINQDTSVTITETLDYFTPIEKHGIYRYIPVKYNRDGFNFTADISNVTISEQFTRSRQGPNVEFKIGDPDSTFSGAKTYTLTYTVAGALNRFDTHDELYWDIVGEGWQFPVLASSATINSPHAPITEITCYSGAFGENDGLCKAQIINQNQATVTYDQSISYGQNLTVALKLEQQNSNIAFPSQSERRLKQIIDNLIYISLLGPAVAMFLIWYIYGRDFIFLSPNIYNTDPSAPQSKKPIFSVSRTPFHYEPFKDLTPGEAGAILDEQVNNHDIVAEIIDLARKKYLKIDPAPSKGLIFKQADYLFTRLKNSDDHLPKHQSYLLDKLFKSGESVKISDLKGSFHSTMDKMHTLIFDSTLKRGFFTRHPRHQKGIALAGSIFIFIPAFILAISQTDTGSPLGIFIVLAQLPLVPFFIISIVQKTAIGTNFSLQARGLKDTINRGKWREEIKEKRLFIEEVLPFAISLGVADKLASDMKDLNLKPPQYLNSVTTSNITTSSFVNSFTTTASQSLSYNPSSSSSSGGSGFSGGSSGGGGGGGGGGSW